MCPIHSYGPLQHCTALANLLIRPKSVVCYARGIASYKSGLKVLVVLQSVLNVRDLCFINM